MKSSEPINKYRLSYSGYVPDCCDVIHHPIRRRYRFLDPSPNSTLHSHLGLKVQVKPTVLAGSAEEMA